MHYVVTQWQDFVLGFVQQGTFGIVYLIGFFVLLVGAVMLATTFPKPVQKMVGGRYSVRDFLAIHLPKKLHILFWIMLAIVVVCVILVFTYSLQSIGT